MTEGKIKLIPVEYGFQNSKQFTPVLSGAIKTTLDLGFVPASGSSAAGAFGSTNTNKYIPADCRPEGSLGKQFVPALLTDREEKALDWWSENAFFKYDSMLVSAYYGREIPNYRDFYHIPRKNFTLFGDSGGFQNSTASQTGLANFRPLNPLDVFSTLNSTRSPG